MSASSYFIGITSKLYIQNLTQKKTGNTLEQIKIKVPPEIKIDSHVHCYNMVFISGYDSNTIIPMNSPYNKT